MLMKWTSFQSTWNLQFTSTKCEEEKEQTQTIMEKSSAIFVKKQILWWRVHIF